MQISITLTDGGGGPRWINVDARGRCLGEDQDRLALEGLDNKQHAFGLEEIVREVEATSLMPTMRPRH